MTCYQDPREETSLNFLLTLVSRSIHSKSHYSHPLSSLVSLSLGILTAEHPRISASEPSVASEEMPFTKRVLLLEVSRED